MARLIPWSEIESSAEYRALSPEQRQRLRANYLTRVHGYLSERFGQDYSPSMLTSAAGSMMDREDRQARRRETLGRVALPIVEADFDSASLGRHHSDVMRATARQQVAKNTGYDRRSAEDRQADALLTGENLEPTELRTVERNTTYAGTAATLPVMRTMALQNKRAETQREGATGKIGLGESLRRTDWSEKLPGWGSMEAGVKGLALLEAVDALATLQPGEQLSPHHKELLDEYRAAQKEGQERGEKWTAKTADVITSMPKFMVEIAATGGLAAGPRVAAQVGLRKAAEKVGIKTLEKHLAGKLAVGLTGLAAASATRAAVLPGGTAAKAAQRQAANVAENEAGELVLSAERESMAESLARGYADETIEYASEEVFAALGKAGIHPKLPKAVREWAERNARPITGKLYAAWKKVRPQGQFAEFVRWMRESAMKGNPVEEWGEERVADALRAITGLEDFGAMDPTSMLSRIVAATEHAMDPEQLVVEGVAFTLGSPTTVGTALQAPFKAAQMLGETRWGRWRAQRDAIDAMLRGDPDVPDTGAAPLEGANLDGAGRPRVATLKAGQMGNPNTALDVAAGLLGERRPSIDLVETAAGKLSEVRGGMGRRSRASRSISPAAIDAGVTALAAEAGGRIEGPADLEALAALADERAETNTEDDVYTSAYWRQIAAEIRRDAVEWNAETLNEQAQLDRQVADAERQEAAQARAEQAKAIAASLRDPAALGDTLDGLTVKQLKEVHRRAGVPLPKVPSRTNLLASLRAAAEPQMDETGRDEANGAYEANGSNGANGANGRDESPGREEAATGTAAGFEELDLVETVDGYQGILLDLEGETRRVMFEGGDIVRYPVEELARADEQPSLEEKQAFWPQARQAAGAGAGRDETDESHETDESYETDESHGTDGSYGTDGSHGGTVSETGAEKPAHSAEKPAQLEKPPPTLATLRDGTRVLGKADHGEVRPVTYANRTQATAAADRHGGTVVRRGRPFYVKLADAQTGKPAESAAKPVQSAEKPAEIVESPQELQGLTVAVASPVGESPYGMTTLYVLEDAEGRGYTWTTTEALQVGVPYTVRATRTRRVEQDGKPRTVILRGELVSQPTRKPAKREGSDPKSADAGTGAPVGGKNREGYDLFKDERGNRFYVSDGFRRSAPVPLIPTRGGITMAPRQPFELYRMGHTEFLTTDEVAQFEAEENADQGLTREQYSRLREALRDAQAKGAALTGVQEELDRYDETGTFPFGYEETLDTIRLAVEAEERRKARNESNGSNGTNGENESNGANVPERQPAAEVNPKVKPESAREDIPKVKPESAREDIPKVKPESARDEDIELDEELSQALGDFAAALTRVSFAMTPENQAAQTAEILRTGAKVAEVLIRKGVRKFERFARYVKERVPQLWDRAKPYLHGIWSTGVASAPAELADGCDDLTRKQAEAVLQAIDSEPAKGDIGVEQGSADNAVPGRVPGERPAVVASPGVAGGPSGNAERADGQGREGAGEAPGEADGAGAAAATADGEPGRRSAGRRGGSAEGPGAGDGTGAGQAEQGERGEAETVQGAEAGPGVNYHFGRTDSLLPNGTKARIAANLRAIRLLKKLERDERAATPEEQATLAQYCGWGGMKALFDEFKGKGAREYAEHGWSSLHDEKWTKQWAKEHEQLRELLTEDEWNSAAASTLNAHYTTRDVIEGMWGIARRLGFEGGRVGEFGAGVGHFFGLMPQALAGSTELTAVERDSVSGRILGKLYPQATTHVASLEDVRLANNSLHMVIGNFPFSELTPNDPNYPRMRLHDYFFARAMDAVAPGGLIVAVTSSGTLDSLKSAQTREWLASRAWLVGAIRLPNTAFKGNAQTEVVTDIIILQKKGPGVQPRHDDWQHTLPMPTQNQNPRKRPDGEIAVNEYYHAHPDMLLGTPSNEGKMYGAADDEKGQPTFHPLAGELSEQLEGAAEKLPADVMKPVAVNDEQVVQAAAEQREFSYHLTEDGEIRQVLGGVLEAPEWAGKASAVARAKSYIGFRDHLLKLIRMESDATASDAEIAKARKQLNRLHDAHVKQFTTKSTPAFFRAASLHRHLQDDPDYYKVLFAEDVQRKIVKGKGGAKRIVYEYSKGAIFRERVNRPWSAPDKAETLEEALDLSQAQRNAIDTAYMGTLLGKSALEVGEELWNHAGAFMDPDTGTWKPADEYLSGNIAKRLEAARKAAEDDPRYGANVTALEQAMPARLPFEQISIRFGSRWMPDTLVTQFLEEITGKDDVSAERVGTAQDWVVMGLARWGHYAAGFSKYDVEVGLKTADGKPLLDAEGQPRTRKMADATTIVEDALRGRTTTVYEEYEDASGKHRRKHAEATFVAGQRHQELTRDFLLWLGQNEERKKAAADAYNNLANVHRKVELDTKESTDPYPGAVPFEMAPGKPFLLRPHQRRAVRRILNRSTLLAHGVGTGKTAVLATAAMELKRLGLARKTAIVVHNATLEQYAEFLPKLYPNARVLIASKGELDSKNRRKFLSRIALNDWDIVVFAHSSFDLIPNRPERVKAYIDAETQKIKEAIETQIRNGDRSSPAVRALQIRLERTTTMLERLYTRNTDDTVFWEDLGLDALFVDEAHLYKKLAFLTEMDRVKGLDTGASKGASSLYLKTEHIREKTGGRNVVLATGTPVTNTLAELWTMLRYVAPDVLEQWGCPTFDQFASMFAQTRPALETDAAGRMRMVERFSYYVNQHELATMAAQAMDLVTADDLGLPKPELKGGGPQTIEIEPSPTLEKITEYLKHLYEWYEGLKGKDKMDVSYIPLVIYGMATKSTIDVRLLDPKLADDPGSKLNRAAGEIVSRWHEYAADRGAQVVFCDNYRHMRRRRVGWTRGADGEAVPKYKETEDFNAWHELKRKLIAAGIPEHEVAVVSDYSSDAQRQLLFDAVNDGSVRVVIGSTQSLGTGVNMQERLAAAHHIDAPFRPADMEQRNGRILRQGNLYEEVEELRYGVRRTLDAGKYQMLERKARMILDGLTGRGERVGAEADDGVMSFAEASAAFSGDPLQMELVATKARLQELEAMAASHAGAMEALRERQERNRWSIHHATKRRDHLQEAMETYAGALDRSGVTLRLDTVKGDALTPEQADKRISKWIKDKLTAAEAETKATERQVKAKYSGKVNGVPVEVIISAQERLSDKGEYVSNVVTRLDDDELGSMGSTNAVTGRGWLSGIAGLLERFPEAIAAAERSIEDMERDNERIVPQLGRPFEAAGELEDARARVDELSAQLSEDDSPKQERKHRPRLSDYTQIDETAVQGEFSIEDDAPQMDRTSDKPEHYRLENPDEFYVVAGSDDEAVPVPVAGYAVEGSGVDVFVYRNQSNNSWEAADGLTGHVVARNHPTRDAALARMRRLLGDGAELVEELKRQQAEQWIGQYGVTPRYGLTEEGQRLAEARGTNQRAARAFERVLEDTEGRAPLYVRLTNRLDRLEREYEQARRENPDAAEDEVFPASVQARLDAIDSELDRLETLRSRLGDRLESGYLSESQRRDIEKERTEADASIQRLETQRTEAANWRERLTRRLETVERARYKATMEGREFSAGMTPTKRGTFYRTAPAVSEMLKSAPAAEKARARALWRRLLGTDDIRFVDRLFEGGSERLGKWNGAWATIVTGQGQAEDTTLHEAVHAAADIFLLPGERARLVEAAHGSEEALAEGFIAYAKARTQGRSVAAACRAGKFAQAARAILEKLLDALRNFMKVDRTTGKTGIELVQAFYDNLLEGYYARQETIAIDMGTGEPVTAAGREAVGAKMRSVEGWHGSPHSFDRFSTEAIGTGEGAQTYGWGLYFTDLEGVARHYAEMGSNAKGSDRFEYEGHTYSSMVPRNGKGAYYRDGKAIGRQQYERARIASGRGRNLYKVTIHKGKDPSQYTWLDWNESVSDELAEKIAVAGNREGVDGGISKVDPQKWADPWHRQFGWSGTGRYGLSEGVLLHHYPVDIRGKAGSEAYARLSRLLGSEKDASLFLLRAGIDGIRYPADQGRQGGASNYVVFDENAVTVEEHIKYRTARDREYMAAVETGDMATAQRMVDEAGPNPARKSDDGLAQLSDADLLAIGEIRDEFALNMAVSEAILRQPNGVYLISTEGRAAPSLQRAVEKTLGYNVDRSTVEGAVRGLASRYPKSVNASLTLGLEQVILSDHTEDPVTYDDQGNVIPLSERFNPASDDIRYRTAPTATADEDRKEEIDIATRVLDKLAGGKLRDVNARVDLSPWRRWFTTISNYADKVPGLKRMYDAAMRLADDKHLLGERIFGKNEELLAQLRRFIRKNRKLWAGTVEPYLWRQDRDAVGPYVQEDGKLYRAFSPDGQDLGSSADEDTAWTAAHLWELRDLMDQGWTYDAAHAVYLIRTINDAAYNLLRGEVRTMREQFEGMDMPMPLVEDEDGTEIDLFAALEKMGQRRGYYMPRIRPAGRLELYAVKDGENPRMETFLTRPGRARRARQLRGQGYRVTAKVSEQPSEDVFQDVSPAALQDYVNNALRRMQAGQGDTMRLQRWDMTANVEPYPRKDGTTEPHLVVSSKRRFSKAFREIAKLYAGYPDKENNTWRFPNPSPDLEQKLAKGMYTIMGGQDAEPVQAFAKQISSVLASVIHSRGSRARKIARSAAVGEQVWEGYDTDALRAVVLAARSTAGGTAKAHLAKRMLQAITGTTETYEEFAERTAGEYTSRLETWQAYAKQVDTERIDGALQPTAYADARQFTTHMLANESDTERIVGMIRGVAAVWHLSGIAPAVINMTALATSVPAAMKGYAGVPLHKAIPGLVGAIKDYTSWWIALSRGVEPSIKDAEAMQEIHSLGWDTALMGKEALDALISRPKRSWGRLTAFALLPFSVTERINRGATLLATYRGAVANGKTHDEAMRLAKTVSDKAHAVYGKPNLPAIARGTSGPAAIARSWYMYKTFSHNYLTILGELGFRDKTAAAWLLVSPAVLGGLAAAPLAPIIAKAVGAAIGAAGGDPPDDPEEWVYEQAGELFGDSGEKFARTGLAGSVLGVDIRGSLETRIDEWMPRTVVDLLGAPASLAINVGDAVTALRRGDIIRAAEKLAPRAIAAKVRALREYTQGSTRWNGSRVYWGADPVKASLGEALVRAMGFAPARLADIGRRQYRERGVRADYNEERRELYARYRNLVRTGSLTGDAYREIREDIESYNRRAARSTAPGVTQITEATLSSIATKLDRPPREEAARAGLGASTRQRRQPRTPRTARR